MILVKELDDIMTQLQTHRVSIQRALGTSSRTSSAKENRVNDLTLCSSKTICSAVAREVKPSLATTDQRKRHTSLNFTRSNAATVGCSPT